MEQTGKIYKINDLEQISEKFKKREFVLEISNNPAYVEKVLFTLAQDRVDLIENYKTGDEITVSINLKGKEWTNPKDGVVRFFNTLDVWKITAASAQGSANSSQKEEDITERVPSTGTDTDDDLPF